MNKLTIKVAFLGVIFGACLTSLFAVIACDFNMPVNDENFDLQPGQITKPSCDNGL